MKLLLTSAGVNNATIRAALVELLGKPIEDSTALAIPTGGWASTYGHRPTGIMKFILGTSGQPMTDIGWKSVGLLELTALPSLDRERWTSWVEEADVLLANGGDGLYLAHWLRESGLAALLPGLPDKVYVGFSAGSMALTPKLGADFIGWNPPDGEDRGVGLVPFSIFPHVDHPDLPENTMPAAEQWAAGLGNPAYAIDDSTAIQVVDGKVDLITEGHWRYFA